MIVFVFVKVLGICHVSMCRCHCFVKVLGIHPVSLRCGNDWRFLRERGETRKLNSPARPQSQRRGFIHGINGILGQRNQFKKGSSFVVCNHRKGLHS